MVLPPSKRRKAPKVAWRLRSSHFSINVFLILFRQEQALALRYVERNSVFEWIYLKFIINTSFLSPFPHQIFNLSGTPNGISFYCTARFSHFIDSLKRLGLMFKPFSHIYMPNVLNLLFTRTVALRWAVTFWLHKLALNRTCFNTVIFNSCNGKLNCITRLWVSQNRS